MHLGLRLLAAEDPDMLLSAPTPSMSRSPWQKAADLPPAVGRMEQSYSTIPRATPGLVSSRIHEQSVYFEVLSGVLLK